MPDKSWTELRLHIYNHTLSESTVIGSCSCRHHGVGVGNYIGSDASLRNCNTLMRIGFGPIFSLGADSDPTFLSNADPDPAFHLSDTNLQLTEPPGLQFEPPRPHL